MTHSREAITQKTLISLRKLARLAKDRREVEALLIRELSGWEEAEWSLSNVSDEEALQKAIDNAVRNLGCTVACCDSAAHYHFQKKWGASSSSANFPYHWHEFVSSFMTDMLDSDEGRKIVLNLEYKFGFVTPPDVPTTEKAVEERKLATSKAFEQFKGEAEFWSIDNLCKLFISYLATLSEEALSEETGFNETYFDKQVRHLRDIVFKNLRVNVVKIDDEIFYKQFDDQTNILKLIFSHQVTKLHLEQEEDASYQNIKAIFDAWKPAREEKKSLHQEWKRVNQLTSTSCTDTRLFEEYNAIIDELHKEWLSLINKPVLPKWGKLPYLLGGAGIGAIIGGAVALGFILGGVLTVCAPVVLGILMVVAGVAIVGSLIGFGIKKFRDADSSEVLAADSSSLLGHARRYACTAGICAVLGIASVSVVAANVVNSVAPTEQQNSQDQDDQDDATEEAEVSSSAGSGKRLGCSS